MPQLYQLSAREVSERIRGQELSAEEYVASVFQRIRKIENDFHAFVSLSEASALERAKDIDKKIKNGATLGRLAGVAVAIKDNICTKGLRTTCSSKMLENFLPPYNATVIEKLLNEDAIIVGKTNMDEFAMGSSTESSHFGPSRNPLDTSRVPGGSSGGSAVAVATEEAALALGSDTGGSIRCPASFCSVVGLKPTYGLVSRYGLIAYANSLEQIGPLARNVYDCALLLSIISGHDTKDETSTGIPLEDYSKGRVEYMNHLKIGVPKEFFGEGVDESVAKGVWNSVHNLEELGASCEELSLPTLKYALATYYLIAMSEASSNLARYDGLRYGHSEKSTTEDWNKLFSRNRMVGFGPEVRRRIILGTYALSAGYYDRYYLKALQVRTLIKEEFEKAFREFDVLVGPTMPVLPFRIGEKIDDPLALYMCDILTVPANLVGCPAISIPCGFVQGLPVGMQIIAPFFKEDLLFGIGHAFETRFKH
ncbi:MAG: Asp-tRNA(Asn)/Glu-tRNA(Gln) amidotransferase subunit GatA [Candidatus Bathyarchaeota archaeon]